MTNLNNPNPQNLEPIHNLTQCINCARPLGQESRDIGWRICHICRICDICNKPLLHPNEVEILTADDIQLRHATCSLTFKYPNNQISSPTQHDLDLLNIGTLLHPNLLVSELTDIQALEISMTKHIGTLSHEETIRIVKKATALVAIVRNLVRKQTNKSIEQLEKETATRAIKKQNINSEKRASKEATDDVTEELSEPIIKSPTKQEIDDQNYGRFCELKKLPINEDSKFQFKTAKGIMHTLSICKKHNIRIYTDEMILKVIRVMG